MKNIINLLLLPALILGTFSASLSQVVFPVRSSSNSRYLVDHNNKPFPILGRTSWFIISQPVIGYQTYINNTVSLGYNSIEMHVLDHDPRGNHPPFNGNGDMPFIKKMDGSNWTGSLVYAHNTEAPDMTTPNESYWKYVDTFLSYCESKGVLVFLFPAYLGYAGGNQGWMKELVANGTTKSNAYGAWIANRYKHQKNIVWMLLGDIGTFTLDERNAEGAFISGLKSASGQESIHYSAEANSGQNSTDQTDFGDQMTLNGTYSWTWSTMSIQKLGRQAYSHNPVLPSYLLEEPYDEEGPDGNNVNPSSTQPVRRFQWWGWLSTIGGYIAGNGYVWPFVDPQWQNHLDTQGSRDMQRLNSFVRSISWWTLVPSGLDGMRNLIAAGGSVDSTSYYVSASASPAGTLLVAYVPPAHNGSIILDMAAMKGSTQARWYDPTSGRYTPVSGSPFKNKGTRQFSPPGSNSGGQNDWVLVLEASQD